MLLEMPSRLLELAVFHVLVVGNIRELLLIFVKRRFNAACICCLVMKWSLLGKYGSLVVLTLRVADLKFPFTDANDMMNGFQHNYSARMLSMREEHIFG